ncbi:ArgE/DapE family deacylase [Natrinema gelatinilyticum]|uniref:ArgE/DapE family deacylase n=1 Tax=Natrinema gelatinilyticum TaxID=2961571 RepID=UPI0020C1BCF9|nr:ArgE/DapE family deacylase [Natrinema gelatinilyticum]
MLSEHREVRSHIEDTRDDLVDLVSELISQKSVTGNEKPAQEVVSSRLKSCGLDVDVWEPDADKLKAHPGFFETSSYLKDGYENRPNVAATKEGDGDGRSLTFSGHVDVVPADANEWSYDPWTATVEDGRLYGRGSNDMLGGVASILIAFEALEDVGIELAGDLTLQTTIEEEAGGPGGVLSALERGYQPDAAIITEPSGLPNIGMASAGVMYFRISVPGKSSHAARGYEGVNAIGKTATIYQALDELDRERKSRISYEPAYRTDPKLDGHETNLNVGTIEGGDWPSTVPSEAILEGRIGWPPGETREEVRAEVEATVREASENDEWLSENPPAFDWFGWNAAPHELDTDEEIVQLARENAELITGRKTTFGGGSGGNDERFYNRYYDIPCPSVGPRGENIHGADEYVDIDSLVETAQTLALTAIDWCGTVE